MTIMRVLLVKSLCEAVMGRILLLKCLLPGACGCMWLRPAMPGIKWRYFPRTGSNGFIQYWKDSYHYCQGARCVSSQVTRKSYSEQTGGEILFVHDYRDGRVDRYGSSKCLVLFRLVVPPLQPGGVGPYLAQSE
jgi:hypothetical protein